MKFVIEWFVIHHGTKFDFSFFFYLYRIFRGQGTRLSFECFFTACCCYPCLIKKKRLEGIMCTISHPHSHTHMWVNLESLSFFLYHIKICNLHLMSVSPPSSFSFTPHTVAASFQMRFYHKKYAIFLCIGSTKGARRLFIFEKTP